MIDIIFMVYLVILQRTVKIMVFIALKRGFNVYIEELIGDFYKPINKVKYWLFNTLNTIRKNVKNKLMLLKAVTWWMSQPLFIVTSDRDKLQYSVGKF